MYVLFDIFDGRANAAPGMGTASLSDVNPTLRHFHCVLKLSYSKFIFLIKQTMLCSPSNPTMLLACCSDTAFTFCGDPHKPHSCSQF